MAKFRSVPLSPEQAFLNGSNNSSDDDAETVRDPDIAPRTVATAIGEDDDVVPVTVRVKRKHHELLVMLARMDDRSISKVAARILEPAIEALTK